jgi:hypothetical protein
LNSFVEGVLERIVKEGVSFVLNGVCSALSSAFFALWTWLLARNPGFIGDSTLRPPDQPKPYGVIQALADQIFLAGFVLMGVSFVFALLWLYLVRLHRPTSPLQAVKFRRYWFTIAGFLLACTIAFYGLALNGPVGFPQFRELEAFPMFLLFAALTLSALMSFYVPSLVRSPPTVIAAVPFGSYVARLRFR